MPRIPELAIFAILQSIMFVLLFAFVFGGAIPLPGGGSYREYLMPGIFVQTLAFASITTAIGDGRRHDEGHHRPLPLAADGPLRGAQRPDVRRRPLQRRDPRRAHADRPRRRLARAQRLGDFLLAVALLLFFTYAMAWIGVFSAWSCRRSRSASSSASSIIFPLTFLSNAFVPTETLPAVPAADRGVEPVSALDAATRASCSATRTRSPSGSFPGEHPILLSVAVDGRRSSPCSCRSRIRKYRAIDR